jgi:DNA-binding SARP family transcriptional activator
MNARSTQRQCDDAGAHLCVHLLGSFTVALDDEPVTAFATDKTRALLAYLAVEADRAHRREALAGLLWPDYPERSARRSLTSALAALRQAIGDRQATPPFLHISRQTIQFNTASDAWVDVTAFSGLLTSRAPSPLPAPLNPRCSTPAACWSWTHCRRRRTAR